MLANERRVAAATHRQALSALLFLYREVLDVDMPWRQELGRPAQKRRIPVVLTPLEVQALLARMGSGVTGLLARLLYGTGMRLLESIRLRVPATRTDSSPFKPPPRTREPSLCYLLPPCFPRTPSFTAAAISVS